jgi:hypothetical protein
MHKLLLLLILMSFNSGALARLYFEDATSPEFITSARGLAMGNAYISKVDDGWAAFYNPAGLGTVRDFQFHLSNIHFETNNGFLDVTGRGNFFSSLGKFSDGFKADGVRTLLADTPGRMTHARLNFFPNVTYRGITLGYMYSQQQRARLENSTSDFELAERVDSGPVMALSGSLMGGIVKFGVSAVVLTRKEMWKDFGPSDPTNISPNDDYTMGTMTHLTASTKVTLPVYMLPAFTVVARNSSNSDWYAPERSGTPDKIPQTIDGAFSLTPFTTNTGRMHIEFVMRDIGNRYEDVSANRKFQFGMEFDSMRTFFFRLGYGDGWGSGGIGVRNNKFIFDLTTYAIEASPDGFREEEDRRYVLNISMGI